MIKPKTAVCVVLGIWLGLWLAPAQAARSFNVNQTSPTPAPGQFDMGTTQSVTLSVTNTSSGGDINRRLFQIQFQLPTTCTAPCTLTTFSSTMTAPAGWTRVAFSSSSVTFKANSFSTALSSNQLSPQVLPYSASFTLALNVGTFAQDATQALSKITARFSSSTNFGGAKNVNCTSTGQCGSLGSWKAMSLLITSFQTTDPSTGLPITTVVSGNNFNLAITVKNLSSVTQSGITIANLASFRTGSWQGSSPNCGSPTPTSLTLATGASGTITYSCTTSTNDSGTVYFTANARNGANVTSRTATSNSLAVGKFTASLNVSASCAYLSSNVTVTMNLTNGFTYSITGITPSALTIKDSSGNVVTGVLTLVSGPTPSSLSSLAAGGSSAPAFTWVYQFTGGTAGTFYTFTGTATGTATGGGGGSRTTPLSTSASVKRGGFSPSITLPTDRNGDGTPDTNASSTNIELSINIVNNGCAPLQSLSVGLPSGGGWSYNGDGYALLNLIDESWNPPLGSNPILFSAAGSCPPAVVTNQLAVGGSADYSVVLSSPAATGTYNFDFTFVDTNCVSSVRSLPVRVYQFSDPTISPNWNTTINGTWREQFQ